jgi:secondary thiamine-phosphate synthase enzyme
MAASLFVRRDACAAFQVASDLVQLRTQSRVQFIDVTELVEERVRRSGVRHGTVTIQTRHTTTGVMVNEHEPLLLEDMARALERLAPRDLRYRHNDLADRLDLPPEESPNGDAHCKALLLRTSETLAILDGQVQRGRWQRVFLVELDGPRARSLAVVVMGAGDLR